MSRLAVLAVVALGLLTGCGKKGAPTAPGPQEEIISGRGYPSR